MIAWLTGTATPLILMLIGAPTDMKMSDALLSAITWNSRFIADMSIPPQKLVEAGLRPGLGIDPFNDHRTVQAVTCVRRGQSARNHDRTGRHAPVGHLAGGAVEDAGALA